MLDYLLFGIIILIAVVLALVSLGLVDVRKKRREEAAREVWDIMKEINESREHLTATRERELTERIGDLQPDLSKAIGKYMPESIVKFAETKYVGRHLRAYEGNFRNLKDLFEHTYEHHHAGALKKYKRR